MNKFFKKAVASVLSALTLVSSGASLLTVNAAKVDEPAVSYDDIYQELYDKYGPVISFDDMGEDAVIYIPGFIATKDYARAVYKKAVEDSSSAVSAKSDNAAPAGYHYPSFFFIKDEVGKLCGKAKGWLNPQSAAFDIALILLSFTIKKNIYCFIIYKEGYI